MSELKGNNIAYLELSDFDNDGNLVNPQIPKNIPVIIMLQASWCGHCVHVKPAFQEMADDPKNKGKIFAATIQGDEPKQKDIAQKFLKGAFKSIPEVQGFPTFIGYKNGRFVKFCEGKRSKENWEQFCAGL